MTFVGTVDIGGRQISLTKPNEGQMEMLARIQRTLARGTDDSKADFWAKQVDRLGTLLDSLMTEDDLDIVEQMLLKGQISHVDILNGVFEVLTQAAQAEEAQNPKAPTTGPVAKRARRG